MGASASQATSTGLALVVLGDHGGGVSAGALFHVVQQHIQRLLVDGAAAENGSDLAGADARRPYRETISSVVKFSPSKNFSINASSVSAMASFMA